MKGAKRLEKFIRQFFRHLPLCPRVSVGSVVSRRWTCAGSPPKRTRKEPDYVQRPKTTDYTDDAARWVSKKMSYQIFYTFG